jgi:L-aspartate oxidase
MKELAPRDIVARTIDSELKKSGDKHVLLDISFKGEEFLRNRFPAIYEKCLSEGIDIAKEPIPVVPAAHYLCGGIVTDLFGRSSIKNLFVSGESACTGVHGANRLASNSLLEGIVFSHSAAEYIRAHPNIISGGPKIPAFPLWNKEGTFDLEEWILIQHNKEDVKRLMWDYVGIVRTNLRLQRAQRRIKFLAEEIYDYYRRSTLTLELVELRNLVTVAGLIIEGALLRKESRGLHYNTDYPDSRDTFNTNIVLRANDEPILRRHSEIIISWE